METSASFEARSAPWSYPAGKRIARIKYSSHRYPSRSPASGVGFTTTMFSESANLLHNAYLWICRQYISQHTLTRLRK